METRSKLNKETEEKIIKIRNKYGETLFRMGITQLISIGVNEASSFDEKTFIKMIKQYTKEDKELESQHKFALITPEFKVNIQRVASELSKFSVWALLKYIQNNVYIDC